MSDVDKMAELRRGCEAALYLLGTDADRKRIGERPWLPAGATSVPHILRRALGYIEEPKP